ncbi:hypothetical protein C5167_028984 [Papaver somniferum]|nr:hypothetical protein C5167_028984 [Papaver somniferum]
MVENFISKVVYIVFSRDKRAPILYSSLALLKFIQSFSCNITYTINITRHIFSGEVNGVVGSDSYKVKDDRPSRIKEVFILTWYLVILESGFPANSCYYWFLRNFRKRALANAYVDSAKPPIVDDFDCQIDEIVDASAMLRNRDGVLGYVSVG